MPNAQPMRPSRMMVPIPMPPVRPIGKPPDPSPRRSSTLSLRGNSSSRMIYPSADSPHGDLANGNAEAFNDTSVAQNRANHFLASTHYTRPALEHVTRTRGFPPRFPQLRSDALENLCASHPCHAAVRRDVCRDPSCDYGRRAHKASRPDRGRSAICSPVPRRLEHDPRAANAACQIIRNSRTRARRTTDENSGEISRGRVDRYNLQHRAPLTLPNGGEQALRRRRSNGSEQKKQSSDGTVHIFLLLALLCG